MAKRSLSILALFLSIVFIQGCASLGELFVGKTQMKITIISQPAGATIYYKDKYQGIAPKTIYFNIDETDRAQGYLSIGKMKAVWPSGAKSTRASDHFDHNESLSWTITLIRPADAPNPDVDYRHADTLERNRIEREKLKQRERENERRQRDDWGDDRRRDDYRRDRGSLENAASVCRNLIFSSEQNKCMSIVRNANYFSRGAVSICSNLIFAHEKLTCLRAIANREYLRADIQICKNNIFASEKISCLKRGRRY